MAAPGCATGARSLLVAPLVAAQVLWHPHATEGQGAGAHQGCAVGAAGAWALAVE